MSTLVGISAWKWPKLQPSHVAHFDLQILHICMHILRMPSITPARMLRPGTEVSRSRTVTKAIVVSGYGVRIMSLDKFGPVVTNPLSERGAD
jgi:hypothetical protein